MNVDVMLRRIERTAILFCVAAALAAFAVAHSAPRHGLAVLAGGVLIGTSYWSIKSGIDNLMAATTPRAEGAKRPRRARLALQLAGRYALLGFMAYVMIVRLRLPPFGLLVGATSIVVAVAVEAVRFLVKKY